MYIWESKRERHRVRLEVTSKIDFVRLSLIIVVRYNIQQRLFFTNNCHKLEQTFCNDRKKGMKICYWWWCLLCFLRVAKIIHFHHCFGLDNWIWFCNCDKYVHRYMIIKIKGTKWNEYYHC